MNRRYYLSHKEKKYHNRNKERSHKHMRAIGRNSKKEEEGIVNYQKSAGSQEKWMIVIK